MICITGWLPGSRMHLLGRHRMQGLQLVVEIVVLVL